MPVKKTARKKATAKPARQPKPESTTNAEPTTIGYISIDYDPEIQKRTRWLWSIIATVIVVLLAFSFWTLRKNFEHYSQQSQEDSLALGEQLAQATAELKNVFGNTQDLLSEMERAQADQQTLEQVKNEVIGQLQNNLDSGSWPERASEILNLSLQYPADWDYRDNDNGIILSSYPLAATTSPEFFAQLEISRLNNPKKLTASAWLKQNPDNLSGYTPVAVSSSTIVFLDQTMEQYSQTTQGQTGYLAFVAKDNYLYRLKTVAQGGDLYQKVIDKIVQTIKFKE